MARLRVACFLASTLSKTSEEGAESRYLPRRECIFCCVLHSQLSIKLFVRHVGIPVFIRLESKLA